MDVNSAADKQRYVIFLLGAMITVRFFSSYAVFFRVKIKQSLRESGSYCPVHPAVHRR